MMLKKIMKAEAMFISRSEPDHAEISGGRKAEPHAFPWYLLIPVLIIPPISYPPYRPAPFTDFFTEIPSKSERR